MSKWLETNYSRYISMLRIVKYFNRFPGSKMYQPQDMVIPQMPRTPGKKKRRYSVHRRVPSRIVAGKKKELRFKKTQKNTQKTNLG